MKRHIFFIRELHCITTLTFVINVSAHTLKKGVLTTQVSNQSGGLVTIRPPYILLKCNFVHSLSASYKPNNYSFFSWARQNYKSQLNSNFSIHHKITTYLSTNGILVCAYQTTHYQNKLLIPNSHFTLTFAANETYSELEVSTDDLMMLYP